MLHRILRLRNKIQCSGPLTTLSEPTERTVTRQLLSLVTQCMLCLKSTPGGRKWFRLCKGIYGNIPSISRLIYLVAKGTSDTQQHYDSFVLFIQGRSQLFIKGGTKDFGLFQGQIQNFLSIFSDSAQWSCANENWLGSRAGVQGQP